jgi:hypothetical protein
MNPWFVDPVWTAFSSFHCEMRLAECSPNDFIQNHHRVAALYFAIAATEAQMNEIIRLACTRSGVTDRKISGELSNLRFQSRLNRFQQIVDPLQKHTSWRSALKQANGIRNDLTHRKTRGYETYDALEKIQMAELRLAVVEICILASKFKAEPLPYYPYWLTGWNFVQRSKPNEFCIRLDPFQLKVALQQLEFPGLPSFDPLGRLFFDMYLRDLDGYRRLIAFMDNLQRCRPYDPRFPFTPVLCRKWWDADHVARGCVD